MRDVRCKKVNCKKNKDTFLRLQNSKIFFQNHRLYMTSLPIIISEIEVRELMIIVLKHSLLIKGLIFNCMKLRNTYKNFSLRRDYLLQEKP